MNTALGIPLNVVPPLELTPEQLPAPLVSVEDVKRELRAMRTELALQRRERDALLRDSPRQKGYARLQGAADWVRNASLNSGEAWLGLGVLGGMIGAVAGLITGDVAKSDVLGWTIFYSIAAAGIGTTPLAAALVALANKTKAEPPVRMVELEEIERPLQRFERASGVTKAHIADGLAVTRDALEARQLLSPEARSALRVLAAEAARLEGPAVARQRPLTQLARLLEEPIDTALVDGARKAFEQVPASERAQVAQALSELVFDDRKRVARAPYAARNSLHELIASHLAGGSNGDKRPS